MRTQGTQLTEACQSKVEREAKAWKTENGSTGKGEDSPQKHGQNLGTMAKSSQIVGNPYEEAPWADIENLLEVGTQHADQPDSGLAAFAGYPRRWTDAFGAGLEGSSFRN